MKIAGLALLCALALTGCATTSPGDLPGLQAVLGKSLIGVKGKTRTDAERLSVRNARECAAGFWKGTCPR